MKSFVLVVLLVLFAATAASAQGVPWGTLSAGAAYVNPFDRDAESYGALRLGVKVIPIAPPERISDIESFGQALLAGTSLDLLKPLTSEADDADLGGSITAYTVTANVPVHLGLNYTDAGLGWHMAIGLAGVTPRATEPASLAPDGVYLGFRDGGPMVSWTKGL